MSTLTRRVNHVLLALLFLVSLAIVAAVWLYAFDQNPPLAIHNLPMPTDKASYRAHEVIYIKVEYCRYSRAPVTRHVRFEDALIYYLPDTTVSGLPFGCGTAMSAIAIVPESLPPGRYRLAGSAEYRVNFLATRYVEWATTEFEVVP